MLLLLLSALRWGASAPEQAKPEARPLLDPELPDAWIRRSFALHELKRNADIRIMPHCVQLSAETRMNWHFFAA